ncbi:hypothetical protein OXYTRIMIC_326 [Oxytricha trifallax]|uniref:Endonuclease/exonuclease/phosphatase domain-containing protein n=1 Tax=Oxytricha trifallax TaxID=1172189 RepID=A0A073HXH0_9SPIT|nr:hypothetical protein OXYTRIMIC_326 [Oxytricha trifallax]
MGDFNFRIKELGKILNKEGLRESIPEGVVTHSRGNQFDQIFLNVQTLSCEKNLLKQTYHKFIQVKLKIKYKNDYYRQADKERTISISDIKKQCWKTLIEEGRVLTLEDLDTPIQQCFMDKTGRQTRGKIQYQRPLEWFVKAMEIKQTMRSMTQRQNEERQQWTQNNAWTGKIQKGFTTW